MVPAVSLSRKTIITWLKDLDQISFTHSDKQVAFSIISQPNRTPWLLGAVYASTYGLETRKFWAQILSVLFLN